MARGSRRTLTGMKPRASRGKSLERGGLGAGGSENLARTDTKRFSTKLEGTNEKILRSGTINLPPGSIPSPSGGKSSAFDFSQALLQGNPFATKALEDAGVDPRKLDMIETKFGKVEDEASLADMFVSETYTMPKRLGLDGHLTKKVEPILASYRNDMRKAHRFVLDNDFVRYASEISSTTPPAKLLARVPLATLPYDITWIEFDLKTKVRTMRAIHHMDDSKFDYDQVADRLGLIIRRLSDTEMVVEMVCETFGDHGLIGTTICYFFSVREYQFSERDGRLTGCQVLMGDQIGPASHLMGSASLWGYSEGGKSTVIEKAFQMEQLRLPEFLMRHGALGSGRMRAILETFVSQRPADLIRKTVVELILSETIEFTGMMRWIVTVLAMLNEVPTRADFVKPTHSMRAGLTRRVVAFDYHRLTLRLPKTKVVPYLERKLRNVERRHKAHEVMSHWRTYLHVEQACLPDEHAWEYDDEHGYALCGKCMGFRRRIPEHVRGDPSLGWVRKDYIIKPSKQE